MRGERLPETGQRALCEARVRPIDVVRRRVQHHRLSDILPTLP
jgi:hypothetical protein